MSTHPPRPVLLGAGGAALMAAASWYVGAVPVRFARERPGPLSWFPAHGLAPFTAFYLGLATLCLSWLGLGRRLLAGDARVTPPLLRRFVAASAAPLLLAAPFGRDLWAYAAQGNVLARGVDPYRHGPAAVPGAFTAEVSDRWVHTPAPYGPLWLRTSQFADWVSGGHPTVAALLLRLPAFAGLLLCAWALRVLAARFGARLAPALWLGLAGPLTITLGVGGGHNDLITMGLAFAGLAVATGRGLRPLALGAALAGVAVLVKSPAVIVLAFTVPVWLYVNRRRRTGSSLGRTLAACAVAVAGAGVSVAAITLAAGLGTGWTRQVDVDASWVSWLSLPSGVGMLIHALPGSGTALKAVDETMRACRRAGEVLAAALLVGLWLLALRRSRIALLTTALAAAALLAPSVQPWYYCWALLPAGLVVVRRAWLVLLAAVSLTFAVLITPDGFGLESGPWALSVIAACVAACWLALRERAPAAGSAPAGSAPDDDGADHARAEVRADDRTEFGHV